MGVCQDPHGYRICGPFCVLPTSRPSRRAPGCWTSLLQQARSRKPLPIVQRVRPANDPILFAKRLDESVKRLCGLVITHPVGVRHSRAGCFTPPIHACAAVISAFVDPEHEPHLQAVADLYNGVERGRYRTAALERDSHSDHDLAPPSPMQMLPLMLPHSQARGRNRDRTHAEASSDPIARNRWPARPADDNRKCFLGCY